MFHESHALMPLVQIPAVLRALVGGREEVAVGGSTVGEALAGLGAPAAFVAGIRDALETRSRFHVFVNGADAAAGGGLNAPVREQDEIFIIPAIAGGR